MQLWRKHFRTITKPCGLQAKSFNFSPVMGLSLPVAVAGAIWHCNQNAPSEVYELSTNDFSVVRSASSPGSYALGIGGTANVIWHVTHI